MSTRTHTLSAIGAAIGLASGIALPFAMAPSASAVGTDVTHVAPVVTGAFVTDTLTAPCTTDADCAAKNPGEDGYGVAPHVKHRVTPAVVTKP